MPCIPCNVPKKVASSLPKIGATVWIEFEQGDRNRPIWTGPFYGDAAVTPPSPKKQQVSDDLAARRFLDEGLYVTHVYDGIASIAASSFQATYQIRTRASGAR
jgi:Type VI secretion system/phage-baseplate injector OB domain